MVQKKGKHGIRSGNTLRAINSKHFRRYRKEAYIVRRDTKLLSSCQTSNLCDVFEGANISCKDIVFSLNKKQRWLLPDLIKETFNRQEFESTDDFLDGCYQDLELVERFKIARNSNCFSIYKSQVESKQGETFHNTLLKRKGHIDADNVLKTPPLFSRHTARQLFLRDYQEQFEEETHENQPDNEENSTKENGDYIITDASPVRLEVLYPCELSNVLSLKPKLLGNNTKKTFQCRNYIRRPWTLQGYEFRRRPQKEKRENISELIKEGLQEFFDEEDEDYIECVFEENEELEYSASIIKDPWIRRNDKTYTEKTSGGKLSKDEYEAKQNSQKIITTINIDEKEEKKNHERDESNKPHDKISTEQSAEIPENIADFELFPKSVGTVPVRILLRKDEITESTLQNHYSDDYLECESTPRSFVISVSKYINDLDLSGIGSTYKLLQILNKKTFSWLIFVHDPLNKLNTFSEEVYSVCLNAHFRETVSKIFIEGLVEFSVVSITEIIGKMLKYLKDLPRDTLIFEKRSSDRKNVQTTKSYSLLEEMMNWISYSYIPDNSYVIKALINSKPTSISPNGDKGLVNKGENGTELAEPCKICHMTNKNALALRSCGHYFCSRCWKSYIKVKVGTGSDVIHCPDDKCHETVGIGMIISNLDVKDILTYARLCHNKEVGKNMLARWCSNESCGRVLLANKPDIKICRCACGETMCFKCGGKPHWPLSCEQYAKYINILIETRDKNITPHDFVL